MRYLTEFAEQQKARSHGQGRWKTPATRAQEKSLGVPTSEHVTFVFGPFVRLGGGAHQAKCSRSNSFCGLRQFISCDVCITLTSVCILCCLITSVSTYIL